MRRLVRWWRLRHTETWVETWFDGEKVLWTGIPADRYWRRVR